MGAHALLALNPLSQRGLNPIKPVYKWPAQYNSQCL